MNLIVNSFIQNNFVEFYNTSLEEGKRT